MSALERARRYLMNAAEVARNEPNETLWFVQYAGGKPATANYANAVNMI